MTPADRPAFAKLLGGLADTFRADLAEGSAEGYWMGLEDLPLDALATGARRCLRECRFMPSPAEWREFSGVADLERLSCDAWERVMSKLSGGWYGPEYHRPWGDREPAEFDGAAERALASIGGGGAVERATERDMPHLRRTFVAAYRAYARSGETPLIGAGDDKSSRALVDAISDAFNLGAGEGEPGEDDD